MKKLSKVLATMLACIFLLNATALAAAPRSSAYIFYTYANMTAESNGKLKISFSVTGMDVMSKIGASTIKLYENNGKSTTLVKTYRSTDTEYSNMMGSNSLIYANYVTYSGTIGYKYYAEVSFTAGNSSGSDTFTSSTPTVTAKR